MQLIKYEPHDVLYMAMNIMATMQKIEVLYKKAQNLEKVLERRIDDLVEAYFANSEQGEFEQARVILKKFGICPDCGFKGKCECERRE